jgi:ribosome-associated protein
VAAGIRAVPARALHPDAPRPASSAQAQREALAAARTAIEAALAKKALLPVLIDVSGRASYTDYIGIVSGRSDRQVDAIAEHVHKVMQESGRRLLGREGTRNGRWALLDFGDVVLHVFYHPVREVFDIESLWIDAPRVKLQVPPEAMVIASDGLAGL